MTSPVIYIWNGEAMQPLPHFAKLCDKQFVVHEEYRLAELEERSRATHNHFFASVEEAWSNLPEDIADRWMTAEHLRKYSLIKAGYFDERSIVCASKAEALRVAAFVKPMDEYAIVLCREATVTVFTAKSQSLRAMGKKEFQDSKSKVLDYVASLIGITSENLVKETKTAPSIVPKRAREDA